jgi:fluoroquinolone resistance protein
MQQENAKPDSLLFTNDFYENETFEKLVNPNIKLNDVEFSRCTFRNDLLSQACMTNCRFDDCIFKECDLSLSSFLKCSFFDITFDGCKLTGVNWTTTRKPLKISFEGCKLNDSIFFDLDLRGIKIVNCEVMNSDFEKTNLSKALLNYSDFLRTNFSGANLSHADLTGAVNYSIDPIQCNVIKAKFSMPEVLSLLAQWDIIVE